MFNKNNFIRSYIGFLIGAALVSLFVGPAPISFAIPFFPAIYYIAYSDMKNDK
jgi:hypothetical protein